MLIITNDDSRCIDITFLQIGRITIELGTYGSSSIYIVPGAEEYVTLIEETLVIEDPDSPLELYVEDHDYNLRLKK